MTRARIIQLTDPASPEMQSRINAGKMMMPEQDVPVESGVRGRLRYDKGRKMIVGGTTKIECKSEIGTTIGLIDTLITVARIARQRLDFNAMITGETGDKYQPAREALKDLSDCAELRELIGLHDAVAMKIIHDAAALIDTEASE